MNIQSFNISLKYNNQYYEGIVFPLNERKFEVELNGQRITIERSNKIWIGELEPDFLEALGNHILYCMSLVERV